MKRPTTIKEAMDTLVAFIPTTPMGENYKLERIESLLAELGNPQDNFKVIHLAGTSGKTSTAYFVRGLLEKTGLKIGLTVSPHIDSVTERIQIGGRPIPDELFVHYLNRVLDMIEDTGIMPTYYELLITLAYFVFDQEQVDYAVIETGMGGLLDGTNTIARADKVCVITDIGLDHTHILGKTHGEIAAQKAGIVQPGNELLVQEQASDIEAVIYRIAQERGASSIDIIPEKIHEEASDLPTFQQRNWSLALAVYKFVAERDGLPHCSELNLSGVVMMQPPGRMEVIKIGDKTLILDGAHNPQKLHALGEALLAKGYGPLSALANLVPGPDEKIDDSFKELHAITETLIIPDFTVTRDVGRSVSSGSDMAKRARQAGFTSVTVIQDLAPAFEQLLSRPEKVVLVTGSLYLVPQIHKLLRLRTDSSFVK